MQCHLCAQFKINMENAAKGVVAEWASTPCATCELEESSLRTLEYDEERGDAAQAESCAEQEVMLPCSVMSTTLHLFMDLPQPAFELIRMRREGMSFAQIGEKLGVTAQAVEVRLKRLMRRVPALAELFPGKVRRRRFRQKHRRGDAA